jgi:hypothetical protein
VTRILVTVLTVVCLVGCTTLQPLPDTQPATIRESVKPGDRVELERMDGTRQSFKVESVGADALTGTHDGKRYTVAFADIRSIGERAMTTRAKVWTTVGVLGAAAAAIAIAGGGGDSLGGGDDDGY